MLLWLGAEAAAQQVGGVKALQHEQKQINNEYV
jgi:hypothetical protein